MQAGAGRDGGQGSANPYYILTDHLGSTTATTMDGDLVSELRYTPWGEVRSGTAPTNYTFTGHLQLMSQALALAAGSGATRRSTRT